MSITDDLGQLVKDTNILTKDTLATKKQLDVDKPLVEANTPLTGSDLTQATSDNAAIDVAIADIEATERSENDTATGNTARREATANKGLVTNQHGHIDPAAIDFSQIRFAKLQNPIMSVLKPNKLVDVLDGALTWTRSTTATFLNPSTGLIETAAIDEPRYEKEGWLIEGASTNLAPNLMGSSAGTASLYTTGHQSPDGGASASEMEVLTEGAQATRYVFMASLMGVATFSVYVKTDIAFGIYVDSGGVSSSIACWDGDKNLVESRGTISQDITYLGNGWYRCWLVCDRTLATVTAMHVTTYAADCPVGGKIIYWGAQCEEATAPSSYITTNGAAVTRGGDNVGTSVVNNLNPNLFTVHLKINPTEVSNGSYQYLWKAETELGSLSVYLSTSGVLVFNYHDGSTYRHITQDISTDFENKDLVWTNDGGNLAAYIDGVAVNIIPVSPALPLEVSGLIKLGINTTNYPLVGHLLDVSAYDFALNPHEVAFLSQGGS